MQSCRLGQQHWRVQAVAPHALHHCRHNGCDVHSRFHQRQRACLMPPHATEGPSSSTAVASTAVAADPQLVAPAGSTLTVYFREEDVSVNAAPGEDLVEVAHRCGVTIPTGCWQGNCGVCEVEVYKYTGDAEQDKAAGSSPAVVRACITKLPPGYSRLEVAQMQDAIWGLDGFDT